MVINGRILITENGVVFELQDRNSVQYDKLIEALLRCDAYFQGYEFTVHGVPQNVVLPFIRGES